MTSTRIPRPGRRVFRAEAGEDVTGALRRGIELDAVDQDDPILPPHREVPKQSEGLEGALQIAPRALEGSFEAAS
jgi:hypothetical protein